MEIGLKIKELRQAKQATQEELAHAAGISAQAVSKWENGGTPDIGLLPQIADFLGVSIDELFNREPVRTQDIEQILAEIEPEKRLLKIFEMYWNMQKSYMGGHDVKETILQKFLGIIMPVQIPK